MSNYPQAPQNCFSLNRLLKVGDAPLPEPIWVGGEILEISTEKVLLYGQGQSLVVNLETPLLLNVGEQVALQVRQSQGEWSAFEGQVLNSPMPNSFKKSQLPARLAESYQGFLASVRTYFQSVGLTEVFTPSLVTCPGMEPELQAFSTEFKLGSKTQKLYLPTSPELHLKKLLVSGFTDIFEIKRCFRNGEVTDHHQPEFQMLEWYRSYADLGLIEKDLLGLIEHLRQCGFICGESPAVRKTTMSELFEKHLDFKLQPTTKNHDLEELCQKKGLPVPINESWNDIFHLLFVSFIEPKLEAEGPLLLYDFPPSQAALARVNSRGWADRFEFYWRGLEVANAFHELNDSEEQEHRFLKDQETRREQTGEHLPIDEEFLEAMKQGLPPSGGIALGLERLYLACQNKIQLKELRSFSF